MTLCPIAILVGCKKCPAFAVCPLKGIIGDYKMEVDPHTEHKGDERTPDVKQVN